MRRAGARWRVQPGRTDVVGNLAVRNRQARVRTAAAGRDTRVASTRSRRSAVASDRGVILPHDSLVGRRVADDQTATHEHRHRPGLRISDVDAAVLGELRRILARDDEVPPLVRKSTWAGESESMRDRLRDLRSPT